MTWSGRQNEPELFFCSDDFHCMKTLSNISRLSGWGVTQYTVRSPVVCNISCLTILHLLHTECWLAGRVEINVQFSCLRPMRGDRGSEKVPADGPPPLSSFLLLPPPPPPPPPLYSTSSTTSSFIVSDQTRPGSSFSSSLIPILSSLEDCCSVC